ncbi:MAG: hypothetical protein ACOX9B_05000 [Candidatus Xenobium sp.]|jgi:hypothetical protein
MAIREGAWDCPYCGTKRNRGPEKFCGGCGSPRDPQVKFYLPEDARVVDDPRELEKARAGPNWTCEFCSGDNAGWNKFCTGCGSPREAGVARDVITYHGQAPSDAEEAATASSSAPKTDSAPPKRRKTCGMCLGGCGVLFILLILLQALFSFLSSCTHSENMELVGVRWKRTISIEKEVTVREEAWADELPAGARELSRSQEVRSHRQVQIGSETRTRMVSREVQAGTERVCVGSRDLGNGYFEDVYENRPIYRTVYEEETYQEPIYKKEPVYDTRVTYDIDRWQEVRKAEAEAEGTNPEWPDPKLTDGEREASRSDFYFLELRSRDGKKHYHQIYDEDTFRALQLGKTYSAKVNLLDEITEIIP